MVHAKLCVFADCYGVDRLHFLCRGQLHTTVWKFDFVAADEGDIAQFLRYTWANISTLQAGRGNPLGFGMGWIVNNIHELNKDPKFLELLDEGEGFSTAVVQALGKALKAREE
jgi:hypothetical protein